VTLSSLVPNRRGIVIAMTLLAMPALAPAQTTLVNPVDKFKQLEEILPTPNDQRTASGAPGHKYWQQRADYVIDVELDEVNRRITGKETITYRNNSPDALTYLWLQLDQNLFRKDSDTNLTRTAPSMSGGFRGREPEVADPSSPQFRGPRMAYNSLEGLLASMTFEGGHNITAVTDAKGAPLAHTIVKTMMRIDLKQPLPPQGVFVFNVAWNYNINDQKRLGGRSGYEHFPKDGNDIFEIAQWFPRLAAYTDVNGWHHKQFLGSGSSRSSSATTSSASPRPTITSSARPGVLQNPLQVLTADAARSARAGRDRREARADRHAGRGQGEREGEVDGTKTWIFKRRQRARLRVCLVAQVHLGRAGPHGRRQPRARVSAMSYYPNEGNPLWEKYSTAAIIHTLNVYSRYSFAYPYPVAISVNGPVGGMEYPMICFNGPRPEKTGLTYPSARSTG
jgi:hypothetical protein